MSGEKGSLEVILGFLSTLAWPATALIALRYYGEHLLSMLPKSKIKITILGVTVDTTLPEIEKIVGEAGELTSSQESIVRAMMGKDELRLEAFTALGFPNDEGRFSKQARALLRPLRNAGLVATVPQGVQLSAASGLRLTTLGNLFAKAMVEQRTVPVDEDSST